MSNVSMKLSEFSGYKPENILECEAVKEKVIDLYNLMWGKSGEAFLERESQNFYKAMEDNPNIKKCTAFSVYTAMIDLAVCNLSVEPGAQALAYLIPRNVKTGKSQDGRDIYEGRCTLRVSGYGELSMRTASGQILYADNPVVVYDNDSFSCSVIGDIKNVEYKCNLPHKGHAIIGCFIRMVRPDRSVDYSWLLEEDIERLKGYSAKANRKWNSQANKWEYKANELYGGEGTQIDTGFLIAKTIKHAFKTYPKLRIGKCTVMQSDDDLLTDRMEDIYNMQSEQKEEPKQFGPELNNVAQGVRIDTASEGDNEDENSPF